MKRRHTHDESRALALEAARELLIEAGPQAVTLKAVAGRVGRTHANLLHHFGSAAGLQRALAAHLAGTICTTIGAAVEARRAGAGTHRDVVDMVFDAFGREGGGALAAWMLLTGNDDALDPVIDAIHGLIVRLQERGGEIVRETSLTLMLLAAGDAQMGEVLSGSIGLPRSTSREQAERIMAEAMARCDAAIAGSAATFAGVIPARAGEP